MNNFLQPVIISAVIAAVIAVILKLIPYLYDYNYLSLKKNLELRDLDENFSSDLGELIRLKKNIYMARQEKAMNRSLLINDIEVINSTFLLFLILFTLSIPRNKTSSLTDYQLIPFPSELEKFSKLSGGGTVEIMFYIMAFSMYYLFFLFVDFSLRDPHKTYTANFNGGIMDKKTISEKIKYRHKNSFHLGISSVNYYLDDEHHIFLDKSLRIASIYKRNNSTGNFVFGLGSNDTNIVSNYSLVKYVEYGRFYSIKKPSKYEIYRKYPNFLLHNSTTH